MECVCGCTTCTREYMVSACVCVCVCVRTQYVSFRVLLKITAGEARFAYLCYCEGAGWVWRFSVGEKSVILCHYCWWRWKCLCCPLHGQAATARWVIPWARSMPDVQGQLPFLQSLLKQLHTWRERKTVHALKTVHVLKFLLKRCAKDSSCSFTVVVSVTSRLKVFN